MLKDLLITLLASLNILVFSFIGLNSQAFHKVITFRVPDNKAYFEFDQVLAQVQYNLKQNQHVLISDNSKNIAEKNTKNIIKETAVKSEPVVFNKAYLAIPKLNVLAPLALLQDSKEIGKKLQEGVVSLSNFVPPSNQGQTIVFGHSSDYIWNNNDYATVFTLLPKLENGDEIQIITDSESYTYSVKESVITDDNLSGLPNESLNENQLILSTCYPIGFFSKRFNIIATPI